MCPVAPRPPYSSTGRLSLFPDHKEQQKTASAKQVDSQAAEAKAQLRKIREELSAAVGRVNDVLLPSLENKSKRGQVDVAATQMRTILSKAIEVAKPY